MNETIESQLITGHDAELSPPRMYTVLLHNDDYTPMDFVVHILTTIFHHPSERAEELMLSVHNRGQAVCGHYLYDIAMSKIGVVQTLAKAEQYPLRCTLDADLPC